MFSTTNIDAQIRATRALLKFCRDHQQSETESSYVLEIVKCLHFLERGDVKRAQEHFQKVPIGGMGCFNDWFPPVVFAHEDPDYVWAVFDALVAYWCHVMKNSAS
jgi:hypothetical protein